MDILIRQWEMKDAIEIKEVHKNAIKYGRIMDMKMYSI